MYDHTEKSIQRKFRDTRRDWLRMHTGKIYIIYSWSPINIRLLCDLVD